ncbi:MAG: hypothetical protein AAF074_19120 [Pseudomonadota bacterium]
MLRILCILFGVIGLGLLAYDLVASAIAGSLSLSALGAWWAAIHRDSLLLLQPAVERYLTPALWDPGIQSVLEAPAFLSAFGLALLFGLLAVMFRGRRRKTLLD